MLGNVALQDVLMAMSLVDKSASALNVDTDHMAAFGLGTGAFMLSLLLMSSTSATNALFRRAFLYVNAGPCPAAPIPWNTLDIGKAYMAQISRDPRLLPAKNLWTSRLPPFGGLRAALGGVGKLGAAHALRPHCHDWVVPQLKNDSFWPAYEVENFSRIFPESPVNEADVIITDICDSAERLLPHL
ncbi:hypothetical protein HPB51_026389 [Rhipicephalus microplus]|uniref:Uncharacterized protein n=1 Tax=Rhipicephalus microplus TaxID=6941 RepID=A0A9J6D2R6_RHIMP|nr:hypothetical protein HPB51_026389 [Rhipicephalus microplus]